MKFKRKLLWFFCPSLAKFLEESRLVVANQKLKDAVAKLLADDVSKTKQVVDLTASNAAKDSQIADLGAQLSTVTASTATLQAQIITLTNAAADNDADDNALADTLSVSA